MCIRDRHYIELLPDDANDRPYCAGQKVLKEATRKISAQAKANGWSRVPDEVTEPDVYKRQALRHVQNIGVRSGWPGGKPSGSVSGRTWPGGGEVQNPFTTPQKVIKETIELINQTY